MMNFNVLYKKLATIIKFYNIKIKNFKNRKMNKLLTKKQSLRINKLKKI